MFSLKQKNKKLVGTIIIPVWLVFFLILVSILGEVLLPNFNKFQTFLFYFLGGISWIIPILPLISWMQKERN